MSSTPAKFVRFGMARLAAMRFGATMRNALRALLFLSAQPGESVFAAILGLVSGALVHLHLDAVALPNASEPDFFDWSLLANAGFLAAALLLLLSWWLRTLERFVGLLITGAAAVFWVTAASYAASGYVATRLGVSAPWLPLATWVWWAAAMAIFALRLAAQIHPDASRPVWLWRGVAATVFVALLCVPRHEMGDLALWMEAPVEDVADQQQLDTEATYYQQDQLVKRLLGTIKPGVAGVVEVYFVGFAGDGSENVFMKEVTYARDLMMRRYGAGHAVALINNTQTADATPLANRHNLANVLRGIGERMNRDEDILFVYLSSHGSAEHQLAVFLDAMNLDDLEPADLANALTDSGAKYRVVGVSACYSGGFLPALRGDTTLSFSAARADRTSFGCGSDRDFTYFGEALLRDQLAKGADILPAIEGARAAVAARERQEKLTPSEPQMLLGEGIKAQLRRLSLQEKNIAGIPAAGIPAAGER